MADEKSTIMADEMDEQIADGLTGDKDGWTLDELINQMCPDGVEYIQLIKVADVLYGAPFDSALFNADGIGVPLIRIRDVVRGYSETYYSGTYDDKYLLHEGDMVLGMDGNFNLARWGTTPALLNQRCCHFKTKDEEILLNSFLFHCLKPMFKAMEENIMGSTVKHIGAKHINEMQVPVPPLDVQRRIAHILDLLSELTSELTSEREARQSQYEWYRNHLLDKDTLTGGEGGGWQSLADLIEAQCPDGVEYKKLDELVTTGTVTLGRGQIISKNDIRDCPGNYPIYSSAATNDGLFGHYGKWMFDDARITWSIDGGGKFFYRSGDVPYSVTNVCGWLQVTSEDIDLRFLYHALMAEWSQKKYDYVHKAHPSVIRQEYLVPVPPLDVQLLIVDLLDKLDDYAGQVDSVLPREIVASQQRYEWWRDRLLDFRDVRGGVEHNWTWAIRQLLPAYLSTATNTAQNLSDVLSYEQPGKYIVHSTDYRDDYKVPVLTPGQAFILGYTNETDGIFEASNQNPVIIFDDFTTSFHWVNFDFKVKSSAMKMIRAHDGFTSTLRYAYHYMRTITYTPSTHARQWISEYSKFRIPVPPLPIQRIVVSTLDRLDDYVNSLSSGLPAEIEARQRQYEWWRDALLGFKEKGVS